MALALTGFSVVAGGLLGWVNDITAEPIAQANAKTLSDAIAVVVPGFDNNPAEAPETVEVNGVSYKIYKATKGGEPIGAAVESSANGFGGALTVSKDGGQIDAITASTITSRAFLLAVNNAYAAYKNQYVDSTSGATSQAASQEAEASAAADSTNVENN